MASNSSSNFESDMNLKENKDASGNRSLPNDSKIVYFDCKNCQNTFSVVRDQQENTDPNSERVQDICKNCKAAQQFHDAVSISGAPTNSRPFHPTPAASQYSEIVDGQNISPLTMNNDVASCSSIISSGLPVITSHFVIGESHTPAISVKAPRIASSSIGIVQLYNSNGVYDTELES